MSDSLWPHGLQYTRPPYLSPTPRVYSNSCPLSQWCHPTISSSAIPFSLAFNHSQHQGLFKWVSSLHQVAKILEFQLQHQSFQWTCRTDFLYNGLVGSLCSPRDSQDLLQHHSSKASILCSAFFMVQLSHPYLTTGKTIALTRQNFVGKIANLLFNMLFRLFINFLPRSKHVLISWLQSPSAVILKPPIPANKVCHCFHCFPIYCHEVMGPDAMILLFWILSFKLPFSLSSFTFIKRSLVLHFLP